MAWQSLYDWCMENGERGKQLLHEFGEGNNEQIYENEYGMPVIPSDVARSSSKKIKWTCKKDNKHQWEAAVVSRTRGSNCPYCSGKKASEENNLLEWCKQNGAWGQQLIDEWTNLDENNTPVKMTELTKATHKKVIWKCEKQHTWVASISNRVTGKNGCPYCSRIRVKEENSLLTWCKQNSDYGQQLIKEWVGLDENNNKIEMTEVARAAHLKVWWKCSEGHNWKADITHRTLNRRGCPICSNKLIVEGINDLKTWCSNNPEYKHLIEEWINIDEDGKNIKMTAVSRGSHKKVWWECTKCQHNWVASILNRIDNMSNCPSCAGNVLIAGKNDLQTFCLNNKEFGYILEEWIGVDVHGNRIKMTDVTKASNKKVKWKCNKNHEFYMLISSRIYNKSSCPYCSISGTSYPEQFLFRALKQLYPNTINRGKYKGYEYDIMIPEAQTYIEYSNIQWHINKLDRDELKASICKENNIRFIQIYAHNGQIETDEDIFDENQIIYKASNNKEEHNKQLTEILQHILNSLGHNISEINIEQAQTEAFNFMHDIEKSDDEPEDF